MIDNKRYFRFVRDCETKCKVWLSRWLEPTHKYMLNASDVHELVTHNLRCEVRVISEDDTLSNLMFICEEMTDGTIMLEVLSHFDITL